MLLMVEKGIRGGICNAIHRYGKANNKFMKDYEKNKESSNLNYWDVNNLYGWAMPQKFSVNDFEWLKETSRFNGDFIKPVMKKVMNDIFLKLMFNTRKKYLNFVITYHFHRKEKNSRKSKSLLLIYTIKTNALFT